MVKRKNTGESSSRAHETSVASMATERQISGEMIIKETKTRITENLDSAENATTVEKRATGRLIVGAGRKRNKMMLTTYF